MHFGLGGCCATALFVLICHCKAHHHHFFNEGLFQLLNALAQNAPFAPTARQCRER